MGEGKDRRDPSSVCIEGGCEAGSGPPWGRRLWPSCPPRGHGPAALAIPLPSPARRKMSAAARGKAGSASPRPVGKRPALPRSGPRRLSSLNPRRAALRGLGVPPPLHGVRPEPAGTRGGGRGAGARDGCDPPFLPPLPGDSPTPPEPRRAPVGSSGGTPRTRPGPGSSTRTPRPAPRQPSEPGPGRLGRAQREPRTASRPFAPRPRAVP